MTKKITILYIMGAGRSGTTMLTTVLNGSRYIFSSADLMKFFEFVCENKICGDGYKINQSPFWHQILEDLPNEYIDDACAKADRNYSIEHHPAIFSMLLKTYDKDIVRKYLSEQNLIFNKISKVSGKGIIIDSSKYTNRGLLLNMMDDNVEVKYIYNIRDVRGVINSFSKNVQTPRKPLSAILYYMSINSISQLAYWILPKDKKLKIKYEDFILNNTGTLKKISNLLDIKLDDISKKIANNSEFIIGPIIEGNRFVKNKKLILNYDDEWKNNIPRYKQVFYYLLSAPIMLYNHYKL